LSTVRIYKVAELLNTTSQEVMALLKRDHGIEVRSASSTIEEVVARQFVDRLARQRNIQLPPQAGMFAETPVVTKGGKKAGRAPEPPPKPAPTLGPPRLVKTIVRPAPTEAPAAEPAEASVEAPSPFAAAVEPRTPTAAGVVAEPPEAAEARAPATPAAPERVASAAAAAAEPAVDGRPAAESVEPEEAEVGMPAVASAPGAPVDVQAPTPDAAAMPSPARESRGEPPVPTPAPPSAVVPPRLRLRIEDPNAPKTAPPPPRPPQRPVQPRTSAMPPPASAQGAPPVATRPAGLVRPPSAAPMHSPRPVLGGPRPLPTPPVRTPITPAGVTARPSYAPSGAPLRPTYQPAQRVGTPGQPAARPGQPTTYRPPQPAGQRPGGYRPGGGAQQRRGGRTDQRMPMAPSAPAGPPPVTRTITLAEGMTVKDLADKLEVRVKDVLKKLLDRRMMMTINTTLDTGTASMIAREFGADVKMQTFEEEMVQVEAETTRAEDLVPRAPVVTVMGHVDHGKTTLLDAIRETRVAEREAGGITQHIGAYSVKVNDRTVVFLDTPGHEAFTMMRARGAKVTDVVILVVAVDDGVMPQTKEAIDHARAANVQIIVALNKIDKPEANPDRVKRELTDLGLMPEEWGGQTVMVAVSAKKRQNLDALLEMVLLVADIGDFRANPKRSASGTVLEAKLDRGRGSVATVLVQDGTLAVGDTVIAGTIVGKIRALMDDRGRPAKHAGPSTPVEVLGLGGLPQPGDTFQALADAAKARQIALFRQTQAKERQLSSRAGRLTLESLQQQIAEGGVKELPIIIKADVQGSAEVLAETLAKLSDERVKIRVVHAGVGAINESDVLLASTSNAIVIGFNVRPNRDASDVAEREKVDLRLHSVIYNVTDEIKKAMTGLLEPTLKEVRVGQAEVRQTFRVPKFGTVAGCMVVDGRITRTSDTQARLLRDHVVVHEGKLASLRRFKDDVSEVKTGFECGITFEAYNDIKVGDVIEVFTVERVAATV
jgi:translation initiation factor IF-2